MGRKKKCLGSETTHDNLIGLMLFLISLISLLYSFKSAVSRSILREIDLLFIKYRFIESIFIGQSNYESAENFR